jgi:hypothetical protein
MAELCCKECGLRPAAFALDYWNRRFSSDPSYCRDCAEKLANRQFREGSGGLPLSGDEFGRSHKDTPA